MSFSFFATVSRMKYIERWALMRNSRPENLSEHSLEVAMIAHVLCTIGNVRYHKNLDADRAALIGMYHDASEIITGDMPTPVKYFNRKIKHAYKEVEHTAENRLLQGLPDDLRDIYTSIFYNEQADENEQYLRKLVKAADKLSALIKCMEEADSGNREFRTAGITTRKSVDAAAAEMPEVADFVRDFLPSYGLTLDELLADEE
ncbi:MAG: 5'-deoxynucleotidase [Eubacteriales bacterium]|nr:5'-deoxynucleotidase [Eubacteriales bacterium]